MGCRRAKSDGDGGDCGRCDRERGGREYDGREHGDREHDGREHDEHEHDGRVHGCDDEHRHEHAPEEHEIDVLGEGCVHGKCVAEPRFDDQLYIGYYVSDRGHDDG